MTKDQNYGTENKSGVRLIRRSDIGVAMTIDTPPGVTLSTVKKIARKVGVPIACLLLAGSGTSAAAHDWGPYAPKPGAPAIPVGENVWFGDSTSHTFWALPR